MTELNARTIDWFSWIYDLRSVLKSFNNWKCCLCFGFRPLHEEQFNWKCLMWLFEIEYFNYDLLNFKLICDVVWHARYHRKMKISTKIESFEPISLYLRVCNRSIARRSLELFISFSHNAVDVPITLQSELQFNQRLQ